MRTHARTRTRARAHTHTHTHTQRRATREYYAMDTHEGGAATNLMEFDTAVQRARKEHIECVVQMKKFWQCVYSSKKKGGMMAVFDTAQV